MNAPMSKAIIAHCKANNIPYIDLSLKGDTLNNFAGIPARGNTMRKCQTCGCTLHSSVEAKECPDCLNEANMTGFQNNEDPYEDWQIEGFDSKEEQDLFYQSFPRESNLP